MEAHISDNDHENEGCLETLYEDINEYQTTTKEVFDMTLNMVYETRC